MNLMVKNILSDKKLSVLIILLVLFIFRVVSQLVQYLFDLQFLPSFKQWDSGVVSYEYLLLVQVAILLISIKTIYKIYRCTVKPVIKTGYVLLISGSVYFCIMLFRLIAGLTFLKQARWFTYTIPSFFHMVLALFLIIFGLYHLSLTGVHNNDQD